MVPSTQVNNTSILAPRYDATNFFASKQAGTTNKLAKVAYFVFKCLAAVAEFVKNLVAAPFYLLQISGEKIVSLMKKTEVAEEIEMTQPSTPAEGAPVQGEVSVVADELETDLNEFVANLAAEKRQESIAALQVTHPEDLISEARSEGRMSARSTECINERVLDEETRGPKDRFSEPKEIGRNNPPDYYVDDEVNLPVEAAMKAKGAARQAAISALKVERCEDEISEVRSEGGIIAKQKNKLINHAIRMEKSKKTKDRISDPIMGSKTDLQQDYLLDVDNVWEPIDAAIKANRAAKDPGLVRTVLNQPGRLLNWAWSKVPAIRAQQA